MNKIYSSEDLENLLGNRFSAPAWAFLPQVRNGTGFLRTTRTADAIAMGLWPSRGLHLNGFEIKVRRGDWLNELKNPEKAEEIASYCDFFWIAAPKEIVKIEEVPENWGLLIPHGSTMKVAKEAKELKPDSLDRLFLAAILRRTQETLAPDAKLTDARKKGFIEGVQDADNKFKYSKEDHDRLKKKVHEFEKNSGVHIDSWSSGDVGDAVKMVLRGEHLRAKRSLKELLATSKEITKRIEEELVK